MRAGRSSSRSQGDYVFYSSLQEGPGDSFSSSKDGLPSGCLGTEQHVWSISYSFVVLFIVVRAVSLVFARPRVQGGVGLFSAAARCFVRSVDRFAG